MPEAHIQVVPTEADPSLARIWRATDAGRQLIGWLRLLNERWYPMCVGPNGVQLKPTHSYEMRSHALVHLIRGYPGEYARPLLPDLAGTPNAPDSQRSPAEDHDPWEAVA